MKPKIAKFDKDQRCSRVDVYNCFRGPAGYVPRQVDEARAKIGYWVPRYMMRQGRLVMQVGEEDVFLLTPKGELWMDKAIRNHLKRYPGDSALLEFPPETVKT